MAPNWGLVAVATPAVQAPKVEPAKPFVPRTSAEVQAAEAGRIIRSAAVRNLKKTERAAGIGLPHGQHPCTSEIDYSAEEVEFAVALDNYKRRARRPYPTNREVLRVLISLGYRKVAVTEAKDGDSGSKNDGGCPKAVG